MGLRECFQLMLLSQDILKVVPLEYSNLDGSGQQELFMATRRHFQAFAGQGSRQTWLGDQCASLVGELPQTASTMKRQFRSECPGVHNTCIDTQEGLKSPMQLCSVGKAEQLLSGNELGLLLDNTSQKTTGPDQIQNGNTNLRIDMIGKLTIDVVCPKQQGLRKIGFGQTQSGTDEVRLGMSGMCTAANTGTQSTAHEAPEAVRFRNVFTSQCLEHAPCPSATTTTCLSMKLSECSESDKQRFFVKDMDDYVECGNCVRLFEDRELKKEVHSQLPKYYVEARLRDQVPPSSVFPGSPFFGEGMNGCKSDCGRGNDAMSSRISSRNEEVMPATTYFTIDRVSKTRAFLAANVKAKVPQGFVPLFTPVTYSRGSVAYARTSRMYFAALPEKLQFYEWTPTMVVASADAFSIGTRDYDEERRTKDLTGQEGWRRTLPPGSGQIGEVKWEWQVISFAEPLVLSCRSGDEVITSFHRQNRTGTRGREESSL